MCRAGSMTGMLLNSWFWRAVWSVFCISLERTLGVWHFVWKKFTFWFTMKMIKCLLLDLRKMWMKCSLNQVGVGSARVSEAEQLDVGLVCLLASKSRRILEAWGGWDWFGEWLTWRAEGGCTSLKPWMWKLLCFWGRSRLYTCRGIGVMNGLPLSWD